MGVFGDGAVVLLLAVHQREEYVLIQSDTRPFRTLKVPVKLNFTLGLPAKRCLDAHHSVEMVISSNLRVSQTCVS